MKKPRVLILSMFDFTDLQHGGSLWAMNFLETLAQVPDLQFTIVSFGPERIRAANDKLVRSFGLEHVFMPFRARPAVDESTWLGRVLKVTHGALTVAMGKYFFLWEREARRQRHIDTEFMRIIETAQPDVVVLVYLFCALFVPSIFNLDIPRCVITVNNEAEFHRALRSQGGPVGTKLHQKLGRWLFRHGNWVANRRVSDYERRIYSSCAGLAALTRTDLPVGLPGHIEQAIIPPILVQNDLRWHHQGTRHAFFVGTISYYPNRLAIEWLCTRLALELERLDSDIRLNIIGAGAEQVPSEWVRPNVNLMGYSTREEVVHQMTTADLFIAPIANNFGAKLKLAECVSYGMPFLATPTAMSGLSFLRSMPEIDLERPQAAARLVVQYVESPETLVQLSRSITEQTRQAQALQARQWSSFLRRASGG
jgi:hypothetical protein